VHRVGHLHRGFHRSPAHLEGDARRIAGPVEQGIVQVVVVLLVLVVQSQRGGAPFEIDI
jgi:hypothetical protein